MVNYNNDTTISTPPGDILKVAILERRAYFINAYEECVKVQARGGDARIHVLSAALSGLFLELQDSLSGNLSKDDYEKLRGAVLACSTMDEALAAFTTISGFLHRKNLTKFDTRKDIDSDDIEGNNKAHGF